MKMAPYDHHRKPKGNPHQKQHLRVSMRHLQKNEQGKAIRISFIKICFSLRKLKNINKNNTEKETNN